MPERSLVFDAGSVISLTTNNLLWLLPPLRERFNGTFYVTKGVVDELVGKPLLTRKYKFEAIQIRHHIATGTLAVIGDEEVGPVTEHLLELANNTYTCRGQAIRIVHRGEMESLSAVALKRASALVIDERTTRHLVEDPQEIARRMKFKLHAKVRMDRKRSQMLSYELRDVKVIRSVELVAIAFEIGLLDHYLENLDSPNGVLRSELLESVLWSMKLNGCAVSQEEIEEIMRIERA
ncbi:hypothetical protein J4439_07140 [Candidatus Woesearchaeota archaeon]|nr:hypothetical protein [Candidatus Woesearchaeota archaeon]